MKRASASPWRRLAPLAVVVLAAHLALLQAAPERLVLAKEEPIHFVTRTITPPAPAETTVAVVAPLAVTPVLPSPPPAAAPRPRARPLPPPKEEEGESPAPPPQKEPDTASAPEPDTPAPETASGRRATGLGSGPDGDAVVVAAATPAGATPFVPRALAIPEPARLHYEVTAQWHGIPLSGQSRLEWRHTGKTYTLRWEVTSAGLPSRVQRSEGGIAADGLAPLYFSDKVRNEQATHFDRERNRLVFSNNAPSQAIEPGMQDRLSVIVQLSVLIGGQPAKFPKGAQIAVPVAGTRDAETWIFSVEGEDNLQLPGGTLRALKLQRVPRKQYDQKVELWLAPRMDYAPVRLRLTNPDGDAVDSRWSSTDKG